MTYLLKASDEAEFSRLFDAEYSLGTWKAKDVWQWLVKAGIAEKPLEEGWYWVKLSNGPWHITRLGGGRGAGGLIIGPRILPPEE